MTPQHEVIAGCIRQQPILSKDLFGAVPPRIRRALAEIASPIYVDKDIFVVTQGDPSAILVLIDGTADAILFNRLNDQMVSCRVVRNEIIGLPETIRNSASTVSVRTETRCCFDVINRNGFLKLLSAEPEICYRIVEKLSLDLSDAYSSMNEALSEENVAHTSFLSNNRYVM